MLHELIDDNITTANQSKTSPCENSMGICLQMGNILYRYNAQMFFSLGVRNDAPNIAKINTTIKRRQRGGYQHHHGARCGAVGSVSELGNILTHLSLDKIATILANDIFKWNFLNENGRIQIQISLTFVPKSLIDNMPALAQVVAWRRTGDKPLPDDCIFSYCFVYTCTL